MAEKKTSTQKTSKKVLDTKPMEDAINAVPGTPSMAEKVEMELTKAITEANMKVQEDLASIKSQEEKIMKEIERNPNAAQEIVEKELRHVDEMIKTQMEKIEVLTKEIKNNKVFSTNSWNGWGYDC